MTKLARTNLLATVLVLLTASVVRAQPRDPARLFPREAPITVSDQPGALHRLPLPAEVLAEVRPDFSDVRIHTESGTDVPYVVDSGVRTWPDDVVPPSFTVQPVRVDRRVETGSSLASIWREVLDVAPPGLAPEGTRWTVSLGSSRPRFVRTVVVRFVDGANVVELARGSVYRFQDPLRERLEVALPTLPSGTSPAPLVRIELFGEGGYVEPEVRFTAMRQVSSPVVLTLPLRVESSRAANGSTFLELARPNGLRPDRIRVSTTEANFHRVVRVMDLAQGRAPREIGRGSVFRIREVEGAEQLEIDVAPAQGERLEIEVIDGDSPALRELAIEAVVRQPVLVFGAPYEGSATLRFGGGRALAPRYDLGFLQETWAGEVAHRSAPEATLGAVRANPRFDDAPALAFAMRPGRPIELARYTHVAPVTIEDTREGLTRVRVPAAVLALARADLADARVVDAEGRQWPYLRAPDDAPEVLVVTAGEPDIADRTSTFELTLPVAWARIERIALHTDAPYLSRAYRLRGIGEDGRWRVLQEGVLERAPQAEGPIEIGVYGERVSRLELRVEDGNDAPLTFSRIEVVVPTPRLYVAAPAGSYRLFVGDAQAETPRYEIDEARELVMAVRAGEGTVGAPSANPAHVEPPWYDAADVSTWIVWAVLLFAVLVLGLVTLRLARSAPEPAAPPAAPSETPPASNEPPSGEPPSGPGSEGGSSSGRPVSF
jgi:hypothetical protein